MRSYLLQKGETFTDIPQDYSLLEFDKENPVDQIPIADLVNLLQNLPSFVAIVNFNNCKLGQRNVLDLIKIFKSIPQSVLRVNLDNNQFTSEQLLGVLNGLGLMVGAESINTNNQQTLSDAEMLKRLETISEETETKINNDKKNCEKLFKDCEQLIKDISETGLGDKDTTLIQFTHNITVQLTNKKDDLGGLTELFSKLNRTFDDVNSKEVHLVLKRIDKLNEKGKWDKAKKNKAGKIADAFINLSMELRGKVMTGPVNNVQIELARGSHDGNINKFFKDGHIVRKHAAKSYTKTMDKIDPSYSIK